MMGRSLKKAVLTAVFMSIPANISNDSVLLKTYEEERYKNFLEPEKRFYAKKYNHTESLDTLVLKYGIDTVTAHPEDGTYYGKRLGQIRRYLNAKGYNGDSLFAEPLIIYKNLGRNFIRIRSYDEYSRLYKLEQKKTDVSLFIEENKALLDSLENASGVPKEITAAIHGMETDFWRYTGHYQAFNVYASMYAIGSNPQSALFQMRSLLDFAEKYNLDIKNINSSYAGAIALCQFMPSNTEQLATGNIFEPEHALASTDNYLKEHFSADYSRMIFAYNHSQFYVRAVLEIAESGGLPKSRLFAAK